MKRIAAVLLLMLSGVLPGCGAPGGGPNEDDIRNPATMKANVAYSTVRASVQSMLEYLGPNATPQSIETASGEINENLPMFEEFATDESLDSDIYGPALTMWRELSETKDPERMRTLLRELNTHMKQAPKPPPLTMPPR